MISQYKHENVVIYLYSLLTTPIKPQLSRSLSRRQPVKIYNNSNIVIADISPYKLPGTAKLFEVLFLSKGAIFLCEAADIVSKTFAFHNKY